MAFRQVDIGAVDENVFVDDRCPTIWQAPQFSSARAAASQLEPRSHDQNAQASQSRRDAELLSTNVKPIEGNLLRKLLKATVEEKQRVSEKTATARPAPAQEVTRAKDTKPIDPPGFCLPAGVGTLRPRVQRLPEGEPRESPEEPQQAAISAAVKDVSASNSVAQSTKSHSVKRDLVRIVSSHGEEAFVKLPTPPPSVVAVDYVPESPTIDAREESGAKVPAEETVGKKNKKQNRKNKKAKAREQEEFAKYAGIDADVALDDGKPTEGIAKDAEVLFSGALHSMSVVSLENAVRSVTSSNDEFKGVLDRSGSSLAILNKIPARMQPSVESVASRLSSRASMASKDGSTRAPSARTTPTRQPSDDDFVQVGEAWVGPDGPRSGSSRSSRVYFVRMASPEEDFGEPVQHHLEHQNTVHISQYHTSSEASDVPTAKSSRRSSLKVGSVQALTEAREKQIDGRSHAHGRRSVHSFIHSESRRSSAKKSRSARHSSSETRSGSSSLRRSISPRFGSSGEQQVDASELSSEELRSQRVGSRLGSNNKTAESNDSIFPGSQHANENSIASSERSKEKSQSSRRSHRHSRHASTRSFSPRNDVWEGPPSVRSTARSGSQRSPTPHLEIMPEPSENRCSKIRSVIGSVASMLSKARSELTFEQVGEGWHDGGVSSDELERNSSGARSSVQASSRVSKPPGSEVEVEVESLDRSERSQDLGSEQSKSKSSVHAQRYSSVSTHHSQHRPKHRKHRSLLSPDSLSQHHGPDEHVRAPSDAAVHAVFSSAGARPAEVSSRVDDNTDMQELGRPHEHRPTVFAGKGWITPHPLESSVTEREPAILIPSDALPNGAILSYEKWKAMQDVGIRGHRNFSNTESDQSHARRHKDDRYRFPGWKSEPWQEVEPPTLDPNAPSAHVKSGHKSSGLKADRSERNSERSIQGSHRSQKQGHRRTPTLSSSERAWERMEEGDAGARSHREDSVLSGTRSVHAYSEWNHSGPPSRSGH